MKLNLYQIDAFTDRTFGGNSACVVPLDYWLTDDILLKIAKENPDVFKIIILDNGAFHKAKALTVPNNIALLFIPPYLPELNPSEKIWW